MEPIFHRRNAQLGAVIGVPESPEGAVKPKHATVTVRIRSYGFAILGGFDLTILRRQVHAERGGS
jgi:hypothetical protein